MPLPSLFTRHTRDPEQKQKQEEKEKPSLIQYDYPIQEFLITIPDSSKCWTFQIAHACGCPARHRKPIRVRRGGGHAGPCSSLRCDKAWAELRLPERPPTPAPPAPGAAASSSATAGVRIPVTGVMARSIAGPQTRPGINRGVSSETASNAFGEQDDEQDEEEQDVDWSGTSAHTRAAARDGAKVKKGGKKGERKPWKAEWGKCTRCEMLDLGCSIIAL
ncbi:uncharacterized protein B0I36DRAFT_78105 [Microdochium trichocladiopsis]|uniref:Uncharacterized protein n=1 Tax=Microdochium trichocladiopsis TaxID=1682393 RepID=A0A9P8YI09_9PEZI|nr:uncharacterized protein B0I36DRAFT_78105 [Microdochium trichocladiopsis]KAH7038318.1 hypothetical protein B0I36DRAFT_78105 [Microdochium trichocladiopsis]